MGQKNQKGTVSIHNASGRIRLRWRYQAKRYSLNFSAYNKSNLVEAKKVALQVERDVLCNNMDVTLEKYVKKNAQPPSKVKTLVSLFEDWVTNYRQMNCDVNTDYHQARNMLKRWGLINETNMLVLLNSESYCPKTYNSRLSILKKFTLWLVKNNHWKNSPLEDVSPRKKKKVERQDRKPFTLEEIQDILNAVKENKFCKKSSRYPHSHYYPFLYFIFKTGCRPAEAVGLRVSSVDFKSKVIHIREVLARTVNGSHAAARVRKETKTGVVRKIPLSEDLLVLLKPLVENKASDVLVFPSFTGLPIDDRMFQKRVFKPVLKNLGIEQRVLYATRHTFGSRCLDQGMVPTTVAFLMGNSPETLLRNYTHQVSTPSELPEV